MVTGTVTDAVAPSAGAVRDPESGRTTKDTEDTEPEMTGSPSSWGDTRSVRC